MAFRHPGSDLMSSVLEDSNIVEDNWFTYNPDNSDTDVPTELFLYEVKNDKNPPVLTNFGLDTLSAYLQAKLRVNKLEGDRLRHDPQLATLEAEKKELKKIVTSSRSIEARVQNGRLLVRVQDPKNHSRSQSAPPSEGDNEMGTRRSSHAGGLSKGKIAVSQKSNSWINQRRRYTIPSSSYQTQRSPQLIQGVLGQVNDVLEGPDRRTQESDDGRTNRIHDLPYLSIPRTHSKSQEYCAASQMTLSQPPMDDPFANASNDVTIEDHDYLDVARNGALYSGLNSIGRLPRSRSISQTALEATSICVPESAHGRSRSFERYADEFRHSVRSSKVEVQDHTENGEGSQDDYSPRPRKLASSSKNSHLNPEAPEFKPTAISSTHKAHAASMFLGSGRSIRKSLHNDATSLSLTASCDVKLDRKQISTKLDCNTSIESHSDGINTMTMDEPFDNLEPTVLPKSMAKSQPRTGKDTFYSASSEDTTSPSDQEADIILTIDDLEGIQEKSVLSHKEQNGNDASPFPLQEFEYDLVVPETVPSNPHQAHENCKKIWSLVGLDDKGIPIPSKSGLWHTTQYSIDELSPNGQNVLGAPTRDGQFPRNWKTSLLPVSTEDPPVCPSTSQRYEFALEILPLICRYLSSQEVRNLRLVNRSTASALMPLMIRTTVMKFGHALFAGTNDDGWNSKSNTPSPSSLLQNYGRDINKFGVSFEINLAGLAGSKMKVIEEEVNAWFGKYTWPKERYPRFPEMKELEDLVDGHRPLLKNAIKTLTNVSELALSIDSGHGWLNGPDISDMALIRERQQGGTKIFGKQFDAPDRWNEFALRQFFRWAQLNTINANAKRLGNQRSRSGKTSRKILRRFRVRDYDDYRVQVRQPDFNRFSHTGGEALTPPQPPLGGGALPAAPALFPQPLMPPLPQNVPALWTGVQVPHQNLNGLILPPAIGPNGPAVGPFAIQPQLPAINNFLPMQTVAQNRRVMRMRQQRNPTRGINDGTRNSPIIPQWPLIFNCLNIAGQMGGNHACVQNAVFTPSAFPYLPGELTETQVQWLMETLWAQRAFLSAYTNSIITNAGIFKNVHSLNIAKLSSGLIPSLAQKEFWSSLTGLKKLTLKVIPDWRQEHVPGDKFYYRNMPIPPAQAALKLAHLLKSYISKIENLSVLRIGYVGGGEHQTGIFARNCHVLPAPIISDIYLWLSDHEVKPDSRTMFAFNHIRDLTFENCWFSPCMLEAFMDKSRDTSLHHLTLDSVSLTGIHDTRNDGPLSTESHGLRCDFAPGEWLQETVPRSACWVNVLENITPGKTILERKYDAEMIDEEINPKPEPQFRGNVKKLTFNSCGYVKISGVHGNHFSQNGLVQQSNPACAVDEGIATRKQSFYISKTYEIRTNSTTDRVTRNTPFRRRFSESTKEVSLTSIMMSAKELEGRQDYLGLGKLTQAVHPIEKRILERAWGMRFGWGDTMERWASVEDGCFEGGTGRFSGTIEREEGN